MTKLIVLQKSGAARQASVLRTPFVIGRADSSDLVFDNPQVSRAHAVIELVGDVIAIRDLQSHNGTYINGERRDEATLGNGDEIRIGGNQIRFLTGGEPIGDLEALRLVTVPGKLADIELMKLAGKS